jgi:hypothetical protein
VRILPPGISPGATKRNLLVAVLYGLVLLLLVAVVVGAVVPYF